MPILTWNTAQATFGDALNTNFTTEFLNNNMSVTVGNAIYVAYATSTNTVLVKKSIDGGVTWSNVFSVADTSGGKAMNLIHVPQTNRLYLMWKGSQKWYTCVLTNDTTWTTILDSGGAEKYDNFHPISYCINPVNGDLFLVSPDGLFFGVRAYQIKSTNPTQVYLSQSIIVTGSYTYGSACAVANNTLVIVINSGGTEYKIYCTLDASGQMPTGPSFTIFSRPLMNYFVCGQLLFDGTRLTSFYSFSHNSGDGDRRSGVSGKTNTNFLGTTADTVTDFAYSSSSATAALSDFVKMFVRKGVIYALYQTGNNIYCTTSTDGITWSTPSLEFTVTRSYPFSMSYNDGYVTFFYRTSSTLNMMRANFIPSAPDLSVNIGGAWKELDMAYVNIGGVWKEVEEIYTNIGGVWKPCQ